MSENNINNPSNKKIEISGFVRNLRAVFNPLQLTLFLDLFNTISLSSELIAKTLENEQKNENDDEGEEEEENDYNVSNKPILDFQLKIHRAILILLENNNDIIPSIGIYQMIKWIYVKMKKKQIMIIII